MAFYGQNGGEIIICSDITQYIPIGTSPTDLDFAIQISDILKKVTVSGGYLVARIRRLQNTAAFDNALADGIGKNVLSVSGDGGTTKLEIRPSLGTQLQMAASTTEYGVSWSLAYGTGAEAHVKEAIETAISNSADFTIFIDGAETDEDTMRMYDLYFELHVFI